jgi:hypothetical protein
MATAKKTTAARSNSSVKDTNKRAIVKWDEELAKDAEEAADITGTTSGKFVGTRGGTLTIDGVEVENNEVNVIVVGHIFENDFYEGKYDADNLSSPSCFAFGTKEADMKPHADSTNPQSESCVSCWANKFKSADNNKGKACQNRRRFATLPEDVLEGGDIENSDVRYWRTPPTSSANMDTYVKRMKDTFKRPPYALVTHIKLVPDKKSTFKMTFDLVKGEDAKITDNDTLYDLREKHKLVMKEIDFPYTAKVEEEKPARGGKKENKKFATRTPVSKGRR